MHLQTLTIHNFMGIAEAVVDLSKPVTLIAGPNNSGKTTIADALQFALCGKCRTAVKFKDAADLIGPGEDPFSVCLTYTKDGEQYEITRTAKSASKNVIAGPILDAALNPLSFVAAKPATRASILASALGDSRAIIKTALDKHVGAIMDDVAKALRSNGCDQTDLDNYHKTAVELRRAWQRDLEQIPKSSPTLAQFDLPADYDHGKAIAAKQGLGERIKTGTALFEKSRQLNLKKCRRSEIVREIAKAKTEIKDLPTPPKADMELDRVRGEFARAWLDGDYPDKARCYCPFCGSDKDAKNMLNMADNYIEAVSQQIKLAAEYRTVVAGNEIIAAKITNLERELGMIDKVIGEMSEDVPEGLASNESLFSQLGIERDALVVQINSFQTYTQACARCESAQGGRTGLEANIAECARIETAIKESGPVREYIASNGAELPLCTELAEAWEIPSLQWNANGQITLLGRPVEAASYSERYRVAGVLCIALANVVGLGFAIFDGYEHIIGDKANALLNIDVGLDNVVVLTATDKHYEPEAMSNEILSVCVVESGVVEQ
ncbi:MAG: ATP-binding protein [Gemmatimonadales bacterium]|nr:ATP-binding protein [Gemmatimonadales bacterium]